MPEQLTEARPTIGGTPSGSGRIEVTLITPGWGSSGWYSAAVLEQAATDRIFPAGLQAFVDHPTQRDLNDRPERSVRDLAAVLTTDARWDGTRLVAEAQLLGAHAETFRQPEMAEAIGVSIRASADVSMGEADGRRGRIVGRLVEAQSVDFVTRAGRGGRYQVIESAAPSRVTRSAVEHGVAEATANDLREWLRDVLRDAYGGEKSWVWVRDFDTELVWYEHETEAGSGLFQHTYVETDGAVALTGDPVEVRIETRYVPVTPAEANPTTTATEESLMPQIEEGRLAQLEEAAGRVTEAEARAAAAEARVAAVEARATARPKVAAKVAESKVLGARSQARVVESVVAALPVVDGAITDDALAAAVTAAVESAEAEAAEYRAATAPTSLFGSFGSVTESAGNGTTDTDIDSPVASAFGRPVKGA